jgi:hypothetical protein
MMPSINFVRVTEKSNLYQVGKDVILSSSWPFLGNFSDLKITKNKETKIKVY